MLMLIETCDSHQAHCLLLAFSTPWVCAGTVNFKFVAVTTITFVCSASGWENASKYGFECVNEQRAGSGWGLCPLGSLKSLSGTGRLMVRRAAQHLGVKWLGLLPGACAREEM